MTPALHDYPATIELVLSRAVHALLQEDMETAKAASSEGVRLSREAGDLYRVEAMLRQLRHGRNDDRRYRMRPGRDSWKRCRSLAISTIGWPSITGLRL